MTQPDHASGELIELNDCAYWVRDGGGSGDPVLFLHGAPDHGAMWRHQFDAVQEAGYRPICPDLLGYGQSARPSVAARYRYDLMAADLVALLRRLGLSQGSVHLVAHDFGAALGWNLAAAEPTWFSSYCAMSVGHADAFFAQLDLAHVRWEWNLFLNAHPQAADIYSANDGALFKAVISAHPDVEEVWDQFRDDRDGLEAMLNWERSNYIPELMAQAFAGELPAQLAPAVSVPTLGVWSDGDTFVWEEQMSGSGEYVDDSWRYVRIDGAGHWFMLERPEETNRLLLDWLAGAD